MRSTATHVAWSVCLSVSQSVGPTVARRRRFGAVEDVEAQRERQVGGHRESVGHGQPGQDAVGRRDHVAARQHDDVERVGDDAQRAYDRRQVAVVVLVGERGQRIRFDLSVRRPSSWKVAVVLLVPVVEDGQLAGARVHVDDVVRRRRRRRLDAVIRRNVGVLVFVVAPRHPAAVLQPHTSSPDNE